MLPTIDFSLIGIVVAIWSGIKLIWSITAKALDWITQRALAAFLGSKFWATVAFVSLAVFLISLFSLVLNTILQFVLGLVSSSLPALPEGVVKLLYLFVPVDDVLSFVSVCFTSFGVYVFCVHAGFARRRLLNWFATLSSSWKT